MAKLAMIILGLLSLLALHHVTAFRTTTVTTTIVEETGEQSQGQSQCQEQIQKQQNLQSCQRFLSKQQQGRFMAMVVDTSERQQEGLNQCCKELRNIDEECRCQAVSHVYRQQSKQGQSEHQHESESQQDKKLREMAESLPSKCDISPRTCQIETMFA